MYAISNRQMQLIVRYITMFREGAPHASQSSTRAFNEHRMAGLLLRSLKKKRPLTQNGNTQKTATIWK